jgi:hypothetical protein
MVNYKMENGQRIPLTEQEQVEYDKQQAAWPAEQAAEQAQAALPDLPTQVAQMAAALVTAGIALPDTVVAAANAHLATIGQPSIAVSTVQGVKTLG